MGVGYIGDAADVASELAMEHVDNLIHQSRMYFPREVRHECVDCGEEIPKERVEALKGVGCVRCIHCQEIFDRRPKPQIRMLDHIL